MSETLVIYSSKNSKGKKDATGAFIPEAKAFAKINNVPTKNMLAVDCVGQSRSKRAKAVIDFLCNQQDVGMIAFFGHGYSRGIQFGFNKNNVQELVKGFDACGFPDLKVVLYACSTASTNKQSRNRNAPGTNNGFADVLRDTMLTYGFRDGWIDAHLNPGHTSNNPYLFRFYMEVPEDGGFDVDGGYYIVPPRSMYWSKWVKKIRTTNYKYKFPYLTEIEIYSGLG